MKRELSIIILLGYSAHLGFAQTNSIVVPESKEDSPGNGASTVRVSQQSYRGSEFDSLAGPVNLTALSFRVDENRTQPINVLYPYIKLWLSTSPLTFEEINQNSRFENRGADRLLVFDGTNVRINGRPKGSMETVAPFDINFQFSTAFQYDKNQGPLVLEIEALSGGEPPLDAVNTGEMKYYYVGISELFQGGLVTQFQYTQIPEPTFLAIIILAVCLATGRGRKG